MKLLEETKENVWIVLVEECGVTDDSLTNKYEFMNHFPECREFRFVGALGMGGKVWATDGRLYVNCYPEDETDARDAMIHKANERLARVLSFDTYMRLQRIRTATMHGHEAMDPASPYDDEETLRVLGRHFTLIAQEAAEIERRITADPNHRWLPKVAAQ